MPKVGIIGGSGLYNIEGIKIKEQVALKTPFGEPSDKYTIGELAGVDVIFLPRHGIGHRIMPTELNYCANIYGMKQLGVEWLISVSAVGSFKEELRPLDIVIPTQFVDRTNQARRTTFFGEGIVAHIGFAEPVCPVLSNILYKSSTELGLRSHFGKTYLNMEGPAFSTKAESFLYKSWGMDVIGMTNMPEARLAREAEMCFATLALITDYDCWHEGEGISIVDIEMVIQNLKKNIQNAKEIIKKVLTQIPQARTCMCKDALKNAIITRPELIPVHTKKKLSIIISKYIES